MASDAQRQTVEDRAQPRDEVFHRARATLPGGRTAQIVIVNVSPGGFMARLDDPVDAGALLAVSLPREGVVTATVRWALGGRIGCRFERTVAPDRYPGLREALGGSA